MTHTLHVYAYIDPQNLPNVGIYGSPMERLGYCLEVYALTHQHGSGAPAVFRGSRLPRDRSNPFSIAMLMSQSVLNT